MTITVDVVKGFLKQMDEDDEFDARELESALSLPLLVASTTSSEGVALACDPCASGSLVALPERWSSRCRCRPLLEKVGILWLRVADLPAFGGACCGP